MSPDQTSPSADNPQSDIVVAEPVPGFTWLKKLGFWLGPLGALIIILAGSYGESVVDAEAGGLPRAALHTLALVWWMACWWLTEAVPIAATSLLPIVLLPLLGVSPVKVATGAYAHPLVFLFLGGFIIGTAMQRHQLHRRIALHIVYRTGHSDVMLVAGVMLAAAFLSMWIVNTATTMMLLPIGIALIDYQQQRGVGGESLRNFGLCLLLGIAYGATLGGVSTLIGTAPNGFIAAYMAETYDIEIGFMQWMAVGLPVSLTMMIVTWWLLTRWVYPPQVTGGMGEDDYIRREIEHLGSMSRAEKLVALVFVSVALLWVMRSGLNTTFPALQLSDTGIAMAGAVALFLLPLDWRRGRFVLSWEDLRDLPWGVLVLFGGGLALAGAVTGSGLSRWLGEQLVFLNGWSLPLLIAAVVLIVILLTELSSNMATTAIMLPLVSALAVAGGYHPLLLAAPATIAASCAFMLPVATPPNAIVFGSGRITIPQMSRAGAWLNLLALVVISALVQWRVISVFAIEMP